MLRAAQKDSSYLASLEGRVSRLLLGGLGPRAWAGAREWIGPLTRCCYYSLTTLQSCQTLGEEYTGVVQVHRGSLRLPSSLARVSLVMLQTLAPTLLNLALRMLEKRLQDPSLSLSREMQGRLVRLVAALRKALGVLEKINTCAFYFQGAYYHLSKRLTGVGYVKVATEGEQDSTRPVFRLLGLVSGLHLVLSLVQSLNQTIAGGGVPEDLLQLDQGQGEEGGGWVAPRERCSLCLAKLGSRGLTTATPCGHLYCWSCILEALQSSGQCPVCRKIVLPHRLVPCRNYN